MINNFKFLSWCYHLTYFRINFRNIHTKSAKIKILNNNPRGLNTMLKIKEANLYKIQTTKIAIIARTTTFGFTLPIIFFFFTDVIYYHEFS